MSRQHNASMNATFPTFNTASSARLSQVIFIHRHCNYDILEGVIILHLQQYVDINSTICGFSTSIGCVEIWT